MASPNAERPAAAVSANGPQEAGHAGQREPLRHSQPKPKSKSPTATDFIVPNPIKRNRGGQGHIASSATPSARCLEEDHPQTVRQVFYAMTVAG